MRIWPKRRTGVPFALAALLCGGAWAQEPLGQPVDWQMWHQVPATPVMQRLEDFHWMLLGIMVLICLLVVALLAYVVVRFNEKRNPTPSRTSHNTVLEVAWTVIPVVILIAIAIPSFQSLYYMDREPAQVDMTIKITGRQWYWDFEYPDHGGLQFSSFIVTDDDLPEDGLRLLEVDNRAVVPVGANIRLLITAGDVLHSMAMPSLAIKRDAIPGRLNESWMRIDRPGVFRGQCSEICGTNHAFMPMVIEAVEPERFAAWINERRAEAGLEPMTAQVAFAPLAASSEDAPSDEAAQEDARADVPDGIASGMAAADPPVIPPAPDVATVGPSAQPAGPASGQE
ncbi:cytochrome c oxidase subunit II [Rhodocista pekingensis]|uniref:Cytochrome c oxidase subunit 2 n=1 Tax=Rhodocista pekingensis TaxID=201185 RepID=A0ABW2KP71_9PROT